MLSLFYYDSVSDEIVVDNEITLLIPCFKKLWIRVVKVKGDIDGRKKLQNKREFMYVFYMSELRAKNPYRALAEEHKDIEARKNAEIEKDWKPDALVLECINTFKTYILEYIPTIKFVVQIEQTIMQAAEQVEMIRTINDALIKTLKSSINTGDVTDLLVFQDSISALQGNMSRIFSLLAEVETANHKRIKLENMVKDELEKSNNVTGGRSIGNRENPKIK